MKKRLDLLLVEQGFAVSRQKAQALILSGDVLVNDTPVTKAGTPIQVDLPIRIRGDKSQYVSRGAIKLVAALDRFQCPVEGQTALDVGASTGGFTQVLLMRGATKVHALDVGHNQLDWRIRTDPRVVVYEGKNARYAEFDWIGEVVDLIVIDVSFISLQMLLGPLRLFSTQKTDWITLIKPQFEVGKEKVGKGGIIRSETDRLEVVATITNYAESLGFIRKGLIESPITGTNGNCEFLAHWKMKE
ncbi:TlyA family RNA methyltransferase [Bdellovibrionota bacterium FG-2]